MDFIDWLIENNNKVSTAKSYNSSICGKLSKLAIGNHIWHTSLTEIATPLEFDGVANKIRDLPEYIVLNNSGNARLHNSLARYSEYLNYCIANEKDVTQNIKQNPHITKTQKEILIRARIGQGQFRQNLISHWKGCAVTGFKETNLLIASHIKPWRYASNSERLDPFNGLLLTPNLDKAFDQGYISFKDDGSIQISTHLKNPAILDITKNMQISNVNENHKKYLQFHRNKVFLTGQ